MKFNSNWFFGSLIVFLILLFAFRAIWDITTRETEEDIIWPQFQVSGNIIHGPIEIKVEDMNFKKKKPNLPTKKIAEIWVTEKGNPVIRNLGKVDNATMVQVLAMLRDSLMSEVIIKKFLDEQDASIIDPKTGMPAISERKN